jgi:adenosylmethionine---8-amino-7-oxononanoate aminotransferase
MDLYTLDKQNIWHPFGPLHGREPLLIERGEGPWLITPEGRRIFDGISSWWVNLHGHGRKEIAEAIAEQARKLEQVIFAGFTHEPAIRLSQNLLSVLPENQSRIFFSDDGSTSVEVALKLAIQYWHNLDQPRKKIIAIEGAYHGDTFGAMSAAARGLFSKPFDEFLFEVDFIPFPEGNGENTINAFRQLCTPATAAFIFEPLVQGAAGMRMYAPDLLEELLQIAKEHQVVTIADEVMTGFYRTGKFFATDYIQTKPDVYCLSKGLTGGFLPMGITSVSERIVKAFESSGFSKTFWHGHSYTANPLACAAANASFELLMDEDCQGAIWRICSLQREFKEAVSGHPKIADVRVTGTILAIELKTESVGYTSTLRDILYDHFLSKDILLRPLGNVLYFIPPYIASDQDVEMVHRAMREFLEA